MSILNDIMSLATGKRWESDQYADKFRDKGLSLTSSHTVHFAYARALKHAAKVQPAPIHPVTRQRDWINLPQSRAKKGKTIMPNQPIDTIRFGGVSASIFKNERKSDGEPFYSATISRAYQDKAGTWKHTNNFSRDDLLMVAQVADIASREIQQHREQDRANTRPGPQAEMKLDHETAIKNAATHQPAATQQSGPTQPTPGQSNTTPQQSPER